MHLFSFEEVRVAPQDPLTLPAPPSIGCGAGFAKPHFSFLSAKSKGCIKEQKTGFLVENAMMETSFPRLHSGLLENSEQYQKELMGTIHPSGA